MRKWTGIFMISLATLLSGNTAISQTRERSEIPDQYTWNLTDLFASEADWQEAKILAIGKFDGILEFKGQIAKSPQALLKALEFNSRLQQELTKLFSYAGKKSDQDTRNSEYLAMRQEAAQFFTDYASKASFLEPEILMMSEKKIRKFIGKEPQLKVYEHYLNDLIRSKKHMLSAKEERIIAEAGLVTDNPYTIYSIFSNADMPYPEVTLSGGSTVVLDKAGFGKYRASSNRADRKIVFEAFFNKVGDFRRSFGTQLSAQVKSNLFYTRARGYDGCLQRALDANAIPVEVYHSLIRSINDNLDSFHRYLKIKQRMLGVETLEYYDLYAPTVGNIETEYDYEAARKLILEAFKPLGAEYVATVEQSFKDRWIDVYPTPGKRSGAYSSGSVYDIHPYILLNYNGLYDDVSTLAHEMGHTMHSFYSNKTQPMPKADYPIFVAEVASTFNEHLLFQYMLKTVEDDDLRMALLMEFLDGVKGTLFRQTQFAEFELRMHEMAERGEQLTGDLLTETYKDIVRRYYGHDQGICHVDDFINYEWAYIPHFYYNFYVYQYSTSYTASTALAERVLNNEPGALEKYIAFISDGNSNYPIELLKAAGVDMTTAEPFKKTMESMNWAMDEIEKILSKKGI